MAEMLLINPRRRRKAKASARRNPASRRHKRIGRPSHRRRNPLPASAVASRAVRSVRRVSRRRANPIRFHRRRRNPIGGSLGLSKGNIVGMFKDAFIGGAGAVAFDVLMGKINPMLPATLQSNPNAVGVGDAVKAVLTVVIGNALSKPTKGLSRKAAQGALITQARDIISSFLPATMALGYSTPGRVVSMSNRVGPNRLSAYAKPGVSPLLSGVGAYMRPGSVSPLLNGANTAHREGFPYR